jgi:UPF0716 protein FxsA
VLLLKAARFEVRRRHAALGHLRSSDHDPQLMSAPTDPDRLLSGLLRLTAEMFVLVPIGVLVVEVFVFIEVGRAIGWLLAVVLLLGTSVLGVWLLRIQGRSAIKRVAVAVSERSAPARAVIDGALGSLGCVLLVVPGFVTDALGALLLFPLTRKPMRRWIARHYAGRVMSFVATAGRFAPGDGGRPADVESTVVDDDRDQLGR